LQELELKQLELKRSRWCEVPPMRATEERSSRAVAVAELPLLFSTRQTFQQCPQPFGHPRLDDIAGLFAEFSAYSFESSIFAHDCSIPSLQT
jgi:hypothetical protein